MSPRSAVPRSILDVVYRSLEMAFTRQCARRYDAGLLVRLVNRSEDGRTMALRIDGRGLVEMSVQFMATYVGGNAYDVHCTVDPETSRLFSYHHPGQAGTAFSHAPYLGREIATFLLDELEKRLGRRLLRNAPSLPRPVSTES